MLSLVEHEKSFIISGPDQSSLSEHINILSLVTHWVHNEDSSDKANTNGKSDSSMLAMVTYFFFFYFVDKMQECNDYM